jgi:HEAT repeat protein
VSRFAALAFGLLLLFGARTADADDAPVAGPPMTRMAAGVLARSALVAVGRVEHSSTVREGRGVQIATIRIERTLKGEAPERITVIAGGPRPTNDPRAPAVPYLEDDAERPFVFFLMRRDAGESWHLETAFPADGTLGREKIAALERHIALASIPARDARARATLDFLLEAQTAEGTWTRVHAARELNHLVRVEGELFDGRVKAEIQKAAAKARVPAQRTWLARVLDALHCVTPASEPAEVAPPDVLALRGRLAAAEDEEERAAVLTEVLERGGERGLAVVFLVLPEQTPALRGRVLEMLTEGGWRRALPAIRGLYAGESDPQVQRQIVGSVGRLGSADEVAWLEGRTRNLRVQRAALFALARIRTPEAMAALRRVRERAAVSPYGDKDVTALVDYLLGPAFEEVEAEARGPR